MNRLTEFLKKNNSIPPILRQPFFRFNRVNRLIGVRDISVEIAYSDRFDLLYVNEKDETGPYREGFLVSKHISD